MPSIRWNCWRGITGNVATLEETSSSPDAATGAVLATPANNYVTNNSKLTIQGAAEENINIQVTDQRPGSRNNHHGRQREIHRRKRHIGRRR